MNIRLKNGLIKALTYTLSISGMAAIIIFQYFTTKNPMPFAIKVAIPAMLGLLIAFLVYYKYFKEKINRKLIAIETAKEIGIKGKTNSIIANLLETIGIILPLILIGGIFILGGEYLVKTGVVLFEILGMYTIIIIGNTICDFNTKQELKKQEAEHTDLLANKITEKMKNLPIRYE